MPHTPSSERATTRKPETAPPRMAVCTAPTRLVWAAAAVGTLARTLTNMPMMPATIEQAAPTRKAKPVRMPSSTPKTCVSATSFVSTTAMMAATTSVPMTASRAMVEYWRLTKALAPSWMVLPTSCISLVPLSRDSTSRASHIAKRTAAIPAIGMIQTVMSDTVYVSLLRGHGLAGHGNGRDAERPWACLAETTASGRRRVSHPAPVATRA